MDKPAMRIATPREAFSADGTLRTHLDALGAPSRSPAWLGAWYAAYGGLDADPVILAEREGAAVGALALTRRDWGPLGLYRVLAGTTNGQSRDAALLLGAADHDALPDMLDAAAALAWDYLQLQSLPAPLAEAVAAWGGRRGVRVRLGEPKRSALHRFEPDRLADLRRPSSETRRRHRKLAAEGELAFEAKTDPDALGDALAQYLEAERSSWKAERGELLATDPRDVRFLRALVADTRPPHAIWIHFIRLDGAIIAGRLSVRHGPAVSTNKTFFLERLRSLSPGKYLDYRLLRWIAEETDVARIDFYTDMRHYDIFANAFETLRSVTLDRLSPARNVAARALRPVQRMSRGLRTASGLLSR